MNKLKASLSLLRTRHTFQIVGIVTVFSFVSHGLSALSFYAVVSALCLGTALFFFDDAKDYESDRIVHPQRPIPQGVLTVRQVYLAGVIMLSIGVLFALMLHTYQLIIFLAATTIAISLVFLNVQSMLRAVLTAFLIGALFPFSAFPDVKTLLFGLIVALPHVGGSIIKDFIHYPGDKMQGSGPLPSWARYVASLALFLAGAIVWLPALLRFVSWFYIPPILFTFASCVLLGKSALKGDYQRVYALGRVGMLSALIAFLVGEM